MTQSGAFSISPMPDIPLIEFRPYAMTIRWLRRASEIMHRPSDGAVAASFGLYLESIPWHPPRTPVRPDVPGLTDANSKASGAAGGCARIVGTAAANKSPDAQSVRTNVSRLM